MSLPKNTSGGHRNVKQDVKRLTVDLPTDLHTRIKVGCVERGVTMNGLIRELLEREFPAVSEGVRKKRRPRS